LKMWFAENLIWLLYWQERGANGLQTATTVSDLGNGPY